MAHPLVAETVVALGTTTSLQTWITSNIIPIVLLVVGCGILFGSRKKDHKGTVQILGIVLLGLLVIGLSTGTTATHVGHSLAEAFNSVVGG